MPIDYELDGPVAVITINRLDVANAIDRPTADALAGAFRRFDADDDASVAVLTGAEGQVLRGRRPPGHAGRRWLTRHPRGA